MSASATAFSFEFFIFHTYQRAARPTIRAPSETRVRLQQRRLFSVVFDGNNNIYFSNNIKHTQGSAEIPTCSATKIDIVLADDDHRPAKETRKHLATS